MRTSNQGIFRISHINKDNIINEFSLGNEYANEGYEYPNTGEIVNKINEIIDVINERPLDEEVYEQ